MRCYSSKATDLLSPLLAKANVGERYANYTFLLRRSGYISCQQDFRRRVTSLDWSEHATSVEDNVHVTSLEWSDQSGLTRLQEQGAEDIIAESWVMSAKSREV